MQPHQSFEFLFLDLRARRVRKSIQIRGELPEELINIVTGRHGLVLTVLLSRQQTERGLLIRQVLTRIIQCITLGGKEARSRKDFSNHCLAMSHTKENTKLNKVLILTRLCEDKEHSSLVALSPVMGLYLVF